MSALHDSDSILPFHFKQDQTPSRPWFPDFLSSSLHLRASILLAWPYETDAPLGNKSHHHHHETDAGFTLMH